MIAYLTNGRTVDKTVQFGFFWISNTNFKQYSKILDFIKIKKLKTDNWHKEFSYWSSDAKKTHLGKTST